MKLFGRRVNQLPHESNAANLFLQMEAVVTTTTLVERLQFGEKEREKNRRKGWAFGWCYV